jgi:hypothetical protein
MIDTTSRPQSHNRSHSHGRSNSNHRSPSLKPTLTTPLLMPPPATRMSSFMHRVSLYQHFVQTWGERNQQSLYVLAKITFFLLKMMSLTKPCSPAATREVVWWPLMGLAALDLALGNRVAWRGMMLLLVMHFIIVAAVGRWGGGLCVRGGGAWGWDDD